MQWWLLVGLPLSCGASRTFAEARVDCFYTASRKQWAFLARVRASRYTNSILSTVAIQLDCPHGCMYGVARRELLDGVWTAGSGPSSSYPDTSYRDLEISETNYRRLQNLAQTWQGGWRAYRGDLSELSVDNEGVYVVHAPRRGRVAMGTRT